MADKKEEIVSIEEFKKYSKLPLNKTLEVSVILNIKTKRKSPFSLTISDTRIKEIFYFKNALEL